MTDLKKLAAEIRAFASSDIRRYHEALGRFADALDALAAQSQAQKRQRAGTVAHFEGNGPSVTGVIWIGEKPEPGVAVYLAPPQSEPIGYIDELGAVVVKRMGKRELDLCRHCSHTLIYAAPQRMTVSREALLEAFMIYADPQMVRVTYSVEKLRALGIEVKE